MIIEVAVERFAYRCGPCDHGWAADLDVRHATSTPGGTRTFYNRHGLPCLAHDAAQPLCPHCGCGAVHVKSQGRPDPQPAPPTPDEAAASAHRELTGSGMTKQAFALRVKIHEVEAWLPSAKCRVVEVHPEVSFAELAQEPLIHSKSTWAGVELRRSLLEAVGIRLPSDLGSAGARAGVDDVLDAVITAWTAARVRDGLARSLPDPPQVFSAGTAAAIWC